MSLVVLECIFLFIVYYSFGWIEGFGESWCELYGEGKWWFIVFDGNFVGFIMLMVVVLV